jgi:hypothetical protein
VQRARAQAQDSTREGSYRVAGNTQLAPAWTFGCAAKAHGCRQCFSGGMQGSDRASQSLVLQAGRRGPRHATLPRPPYCEERKFA